MNKEKLVELGLEDDKIKSILGIYQESIKEYVAKADHDLVKTELDQTKQTVASRDKQIDELKKFEGTTQELQARVEKLSNDNKQLSEEHEKTLQTERKRNKVHMALINDDKNVPHDADLIIGMLQMDRISLDNSGNLVGLQDQKEALIKDSPFLFKEAVVAPGGTKFTPQGEEPESGEENRNSPSTDAIKIAERLASQRRKMLGLDSK